MLAASLLQKLGIYVVEGFMLASECTNLCAKMRAAAKIEAATFGQTNNTEHIDHSVRKTHYCNVSDESRKAVYKLIKGIIIQLEAFFETSLADEFEQPKFLQYSKGSFFSPNTDEQLNRKINLNNKHELDSTGYAGGELRLYGLIKQRGFSTRGIAAPMTADSLIAYPVDVVHEVTPISAGARFCIVSRYLTSVQI